MKGAGSSEILYMHIIGLCVINVTATQLHIPILAYDNHFT